MLPSSAKVQLRHAEPPASDADLAAYDAILIVTHADSKARRVDPAPLQRLAGGSSWRRLLERMQPQAGSSVTVHLPNSRQTHATILLARQGGTPFDQHQLAGRAVRETLNGKPRRVLVWSAGRPEPHRDALEGVLLALLSQSFALPRFQSRKPTGPARPLTRIDVAGAASLDLERLGIESRAQNLARWLTALPPNKLDTMGYRRVIASLARRHGLRLRWLDEAALRRAGAGAFLAVAAGNARRDAAGIAHLSYRPRRRPRASVADVALVGKGILFDTGGTNLKPHRAMLDMHMDMAGSAVALATLVALAESRAPLAADAWLAITENRIGPTAYTPQQVVTAANGTTIQVIHTDAEGRMALADTLALAARSGARTLVDFATLTGAAVYALTERMSALLGSDAALNAELLAAGHASGERLVAFPMPEDFDAELESKIADVIQCTVEGKGDHILAARFLQRFVPEKLPWAHIDLAAAQRHGGLGLVATDVTGFGVRLTLRWLEQHQRGRGARS